MTASRNTRQRLATIFERPPLRLIQTPSRLQAGLLLAGLLLVTGCGRDPGPAASRAGTDLATGDRPPGAEAPDATSEQRADSAPSGRANLSSGFELPEGEIPPATSFERSQGKGAGLEMPKDVIVPQSSDGARLESADNAAELAGTEVPGSDPSQPEIQYASWEEIDSLARSVPGRVTVLDLWSLSCEPCLKEFPGLVQLHQSMGEQVRCIAVNLDFDGRASRPPESYEEQVVSFLKSVGASGFPSFISRTDSDDVFNATKLASIPAVLVFDADGSIAKVFVDAGETLGFTYEKDVVPFVRQLVD